MLNYRQKIQLLPFDKDLAFLPPGHLNKPQARTDKMQEHGAHSSLGAMLRKQAMGKRERRDV